MEALADSELPQPGRSVKERHSMDVGHAPAGVTEYLHGRSIPEQHASLQPSVGTEVPIVPAVPMVTEDDHEDCNGFCSSPRFGSGSTAAVLTTTRSTSWPAPERAMARTVRGR
jgi:hypothetical protein